MNILSAACGLWLGLMATGPAAAAAEVPALAEEAVEVAYKEGHYAAHLSFTLPVGRDLALAVLTDFDHLAEFLPGLKRSQLLERQGNVARIVQEGEVAVGPFRLPFESIRRVEWHPDGRLVSKTLSSSSAHSTSEMRLQAVPGGTRFDYQLDVLPTTWMPATLGIGVMRRELAGQFSALAREMLRRQGVTASVAESEKQYAGPDRRRIEQ